ncbi:FAD-dependent oxidoreductase [bacterium]|nr:FAD-dependent oxidoreductase [bacterium]
MSKRIVVVGSNFAGYTAAIELKKHLGDEHNVSVISASDEFLFMPSLIWVPFGLREKKQIAFKVEPQYRKRGIEFRHARVEEIDPQKQELRFEGGKEEYDYLVLATGPELNYGAVKGLGPYDGYTQSIFSWDAAELAHEAFLAWEQKPGPVVIGAVQGASCFGAAYEFLLNFAHELRKRKLHKKVPLTYVTAEPFLGHFGIGGLGNAKAMCEWFFKHLNISFELDAAVREISDSKIQLEDGRSLDYSYAMLAPAFRGVETVRNVPGLTNAGGWVRTDGHYRSYAYENIFAAGVAVALDAPQPTAVPCGVPKTGYLSEEMAKVAVHNIAAEIHGQPLISLPPASIDAKCVLDAGNTGIIMLSDHFLEPRKQAWLIPGPEAHWAKLAFEKYFLTTRKRGMV